MGLNTQEHLDDPGSHAVSKKGFLELTFGIFGFKIVRFMQTIGSKYSIHV